MNTTPISPLVAVVTPIYNGGKHLEETMECVQAQTYPNIVHIVLNNASKDNTAEIIAKYANGTTNFPVIAHKNQAVLPIGENWNAAISHTPKDAKYIRFLCADDLMKPDFVEKSVAIAEFDDNISAVASYITKNDTPQDFGVLFDASMLGMDFEAFLAILKNKKLGMIHEELGWVRMHEDSQTSTVMLKKNTHFADWHTALYRHGKDVFSPAEFEAVAKNFERYYLGKCRGWQRENGGNEVVKYHEKRFAETRSPITNMDKLDSLLHGALVKAGIRPSWTGWPN